MDSSSTAKISFNNVPKDNRALAAEIHDLVRDQQRSTLPREKDNEETDETQLKSLLERLYVGICDFGQFIGSAATPDKKIIASWESFFEPIGALAEVRPHGHMMAARMILYLTNAFLRTSQLSRRFSMSDSSLKPIALRCNFLIALDDTLLSHLTHIWSHGDRREMFYWVLTEHAVYDTYCLDENCRDLLNPELSSEALHERRKNDRFRAARVTRPSDLTPENGVRRRWRWTRQQGDTTAYSRHPDCSRAVYDDYEKEKDERLLMWQDIGSDGPIRESYNYSLVDEDTGKTEWRDRPALRRSRQFVLDAQKIAAFNISKDRRRLAEFAMARSPLPLELQVEVLGYLEDAPEHPYLSKLDLAAVYQPFPDISKTCVECPSRGDNAAGKMARATCPHRSITIWSLPLRMFHSFHLRNRKWVLCVHHGCNGHHRDASWSGPSREPTMLLSYLNKAVQGRLGPWATYHGIGLGPLYPVELPTEGEDEARKQRLFTYDHSDYEKSDTREEALWIGLGGLEDVMLHGRTLTGRHTSGSSTTATHWMVGRTRQEEQRVRSALMDTHTAACYYC